MACSKRSRLDDLTPNILTLYEKAMTSGQSINLLSVQAASALAAGAVHQAFLFIKRDLNMNHALDCDSLTRQLCNYTVRKISTKFFNYNENGFIKICRCPRIEKVSIQKSNKVDQSPNTLTHCIACQCIIAFKGHCASYVRTVLINPTVEIKEHHSFLIMIEKKVIQNLRVGVELCQVYSTVHAFASQENEYLSMHLEKDFGVLLNNDFKGEYPPIDPDDTIEKALKEYRFPISNFKNDSVIINEKNNTITEEGMVFFINIKLTGLRDQNLSIDYCLSTGDTVMVLKDSPSKVLTSQNGELIQCISEKDLLVPEGVIS